MIQRGKTWDMSNTKKKTSIERNDFLWKFLLIFYPIWFFLIIYYFDGFSNSSRTKSDAK